MDTRHWLIVASQNHVQRGSAGGFAQACHGKPGPLRQMRTGDWVVFYSPTLEFRGPEKCQAFTAIGQVSDELVYQVDMGAGFEPFRRNVHFHACTPAPIRPLINDLSFISDKQRWGFPFRRGFMAIPAADFERIAAAMALTAQAAL